MSEDFEIKVGDVVALKSGGPPMTVVRLLPKAEDGPSAKCVWFQGEAMPHEMSFVQRALTVLEDVDSDEEE
jgi:uncharacterized protein YodC (DUF2158 family)